MNPFTWIRSAARNAFLGGIQDAIEQVAGDAGALTIKVELPAIAGSAIEEGESRPATKKRAGQ